MKRGYSIIADNLFDAFENNTYNLKITKFFDYKEDVEEIREKMRELHMKKPFRLHIFFTDIKESEPSFMRSKYQNPVEEMTKANVKEGMKDLFYEDLIVRASLNSLADDKEYQYLNHNIYIPIVRYDAIFPLSVLFNSTPYTDGNLVASYIRQPFFAVEFPKRGELYLYPTRKPRDEFEENEIEKQSKIFAHYWDDYGGFIYLIKVDGDAEVYLVEDNLYVPYTSLNDILEKQPFLKVKKIKEYVFK